MTVLFLIFFGQICPKWIKVDQTWSKLIKLDQIGFLINLKKVTIKVVTFTDRIKMTVLFLIFFGSDLSKMDQTWSKWISHQSKNVAIKSCHIYRKDKNACYVFGFFGSDLSKMDQIWSNWISHQSKTLQ